MKEIKKTMMLVLLVIILLAITEIGFNFFVQYSLKYQSSGGYYKLLHTLYSTEAEVIGVGSSVAEVTLNPSIMADSLGLTCWNGGRGSQLIQYFLCVQEKVLERYKPDFVIQFMQPHDLESPLTYDSIRQLKPLTKQDKSIRKYLYPESPFQQFLLNSSLWANNSNIFYLMYALINRGPNRGNDTCGQKPIYGTYRSPLSDVAPIVYSMNEIVPDTATQFDKLVKTYVDSGCELFIVICPYFETDCLNSPTIEWIYEQERNYPNVHFLNYWNDPRYIGKREYYYDFIHLNNIGADLLTRDIAHEIMNFIRESNKKTSRFGGVI